METWSASAVDGQGGVGKRGKRRSETVSVRLDPKLRYLAELAARRQRRTVSSFIEWAIEASLDKVALVESDGFGPPAVSLGNVSAVLWDVDPADRFVKLALRYPDLLNHEEQRLWKLFRGNGLFWKGHYDKEHKWIFQIADESSVSFRNLREQWDLINKIARGEVPVSEMPKMAEGPGAQVSPATGLAPMDDDDIPF
jgi:hypothetical protein